NHGFSWTVFIQAPPGHPPAIDQPLIRRNGPESQPSRELKATVPTTETATQGETPEAESTEKPAHTAHPRPPAQAETPRKGSGSTTRFKRKAEKPIQKDEGTRIIRLDEDLLTAQNGKSAKQDSSAAPKAQAGESTARVEHELQCLHIRAEENETARKLLVAD